jgi:hypothetical protein
MLTRANQGLLLKGETERSEQGPVLIGFERLGSVRPLIVKFAFVWLFSHTRKQYVLERIGWGEGRCTDDPS